jgi:hypothetical protein
MKRFFILIVTSLNIMMTKIENNVMEEVSSTKEEKANA